MLGILKRLGFVWVYVWGVERVSVSGVEWVYVSAFRRLMLGKGTLTGFVSGIERLCV